MTAMSVFTKSSELYTRNIDIVSGYIEQNAHYLSIQTGDPYEVCYDFVKRSISPDGEFSLKDPQVLFLERAGRGDRKLTTSSLLEYVNFVDKNNYIISPSMTVYLPRHVKPSLLAEWIDMNLKLRKKFKTAMLDCAQKGDTDGESFNNVNQTGVKYDNNSLSGAATSPFNPTYNKSAHSTLTSTCRVATSYGNANNEKFLAGNRHYWCADVVLANVITITKYTNLNNLRAVLDKYNIYYPNTDDVMDCITYSTDNYWREPARLESIRNFVDKLTAVQKAAVLYVGDLFHLAKHNPELVRGFITRISKKSDRPLSVEDADREFKNISDDNKALVWSLCSNITTGLKPNEVKSQNPYGYGICGATARNLRETLDDHVDFIDALWKPDILPPSIYRLPAILRKAVLTSDTDSTIFTTQYWTKWMVGKLDFSPESYATGYAISFLTSQIVIHYLAMLSANMGVDRELIHKLSMKNEYYFPVYVLTNAAKHYFAYVSACEGNVYKNMKIQIKGVGLKNSNIKLSVMQALEIYMKDIMDKVMAKGFLTIQDVLDVPARIEHSILKDIQNKGFEYFKSMQVRDHGAYKQGSDNAVYQSYILWNQVFAEKYGVCPQPPYMAVKVSVDLKSKTKVKRWLESMEDQTIAQKMQQYLSDRSKSDVTTLYLPKENLLQHGVPEEIVPTITARSLVKEIMSGFYIVLESLGFYYNNDKATKLLSDEYVVDV